MDQWKLGISRIPEREFMVGGLADAVCLSVGEEVVLGTGMWLVIKPIRTQ